MDRTKEQKRKLNELRINNKNKNKNKRKNELRKQNIIIINNNK